MLQTVSLRKLLLGLIFCMSCSLICWDAKAQAPNWDSVYADFLKMYQPVDTPAWLFPMCFKNNFGEWDTIYLGYDNNATSLLDTILGEIKLIPLDASKFNAFLNTTSNEDSALKYEVNNFSNMFSIDFTEGILPLTMYWDNRQFYSDSLPFPDLDTLPRARGELFCSDGSPYFTNCSHSEIILTDLSFAGMLGPFVRMDSMYFDGNGIDDQPGTLLLYFVPFDDPTSGTDEPIQSSGFEIYPNPARDHLWIHSEPHIPFRYEIYNLLSEIVVHSAVAASGEIKIDLQGLHSGIYFVQINTEKGSLTSKIILL